MNPSNATAGGTVWSRRWLEDQTMFSTVLRLLALIAFVLAMLPVVVLPVGLVPLGLALWVGSTLV